MKRNTSFDEILVRYRWPIGLSLMLIILVGSGFLVYQKFGHQNQNEQSQITELKNQNELLRQELSGKSQVVSGAATVDPAAQTDKININTATVAELDKLPSIGPVYANAILAYRQDKGAFKTIEEIKNVKGIGDKTFEKFKDMITVGE